MASDEASTDAAERAWKEYGKDQMKKKSKDELCFPLSEKKKSMGKSGFVPESLSKQDILNMILVPVMKPIGLDEEEKEWARRIVEDLGEGRGRRFGVEKEVGDTDEQNLLI